MSLQELLEFQILQVFDYTFTVHILFVSLLTIIIAKAVMYFLKTLMFKVSERGIIPDRRYKSVYSLLNYIIWGIAIIIILQVFGINLTIVLAGSAALLVGLGFGLKRVFEDFISGVILLIDGTIKSNDVIEIDGMVASVLDIKLRYSKVVTRDDIIIIIPNSQLISQKVINWSHNIDSTRFYVKVGVEYSSDPKKVEHVLIQCAKNNKHIHNEPPYTPFVRFNEFGDSSLEFQLLFWTDNSFRVENIRSELRFSIFEAFKTAGITIAYPQRDIHIKTLPEGFRNTQMFRTN
jgi:small-conductance mechanosensitive channel